VSTADAALPAAAAPDEARPWRSAALWLLFLAPFFWERQIPFLDWTIIPYWSINAFYGLSVFVCATKAELDTHGRRLLTAQIVAVVCFLLFPLRFDFVQPETHGFAGFLFAVLTGFDKPFNQAPSLHIALLVILWVLYARHVPRWALWLLHPWFLLVGVSVLTTYQHHFIDIPTGALLGFFCLWLWPDHGKSPTAAFQLTSSRRRLALAGRYLAGAIVTAALALWIGGAALWLIWPAVSLVLVAANYAVFGAAGFQKGADGRMSLAARVLLAPYLAGAWINSRAWTRREPAPVTVADGVALGRLPARKVAAEFATVIDLSAELPRPRGRAAWRAFPTLDLVVPQPQLLCAAAQAIEEARARGPVLVCCALGYSRSASALATWLITHGHADGAAAAVERIRRARPQVVIGDDTVAAIMRAAMRAP
jgi:protein-tyrosine phosphatase/membrane-associated phospholipid phosphatase